jgi:protein SDA1
MQAELRRRLVTALVLMRNRSLLPPLDVIPLLFRLFRVPDKALRAMAFTAIIGDIKKVIG